LIMASSNAFTRNNFSTTSEINISTKLPAL
jgi:hypothetical protein